VDYEVERHERHIVLRIAGRRWVLRDEAELELMLAVFGGALVGRAGVNARSARPRCSSRRCAPGNNIEHAREHPFCSSKPAHGNG